MITTYSFHALRWSDHHPSGAASQQGVIPHWPGSRTPEDNDDDQNQNPARSLTTQGQNIGDYVEEDEGKVDERRSGIRRLADKITAHRDGEVTTHHFTPAFLQDYLALSRQDKLHSSTNLFPSLSGPPLPPSSSSPFFELPFDSPLPPSPFFLSSSAQFLLNQVRSTTLLLRLGLGSAFPRATDY